MVPLLSWNVLYIIVIVLLYYIVLLSSFYHSLGCFLMTLGLRAHIGDPRYCCIRYFSRLLWDPHPFQFMGIFVSCFCYIIYPCFHICSDYCPLLQVFLYLFMLHLLCILYIFLVLRLSVHTWGYFRSAYIHIAVASSYPRDRDVTQYMSFFSNTWSIKCNNHRSRYANLGSQNSQWVCKEWGKRCTCISSVNIVQHDKNILDNNSMTKTLIKRWYGTIYH